MTEMPEQSFAPIYRKLFDEYRNDILNLRYRPGDRIDSINDIVMRHNVSRETAKLVLKCLVKEELIVQKAGKGSFVAERAEKRSVWGVILPFYSPAFEQLIGELNAHALTAGCQLNHFISYNSWKEEIRLVGWMINERFEAVLVAPTLDESETADFYRRLSAQQSIICLIDHTMTGSLFPYVIQSYDLGVQRAVEHLFGRCTGTVALVRNETWSGRNIVQEMMEETFKIQIERHRPGSIPQIIERASALEPQFLEERGIGGLLCCDDVDAVRTIGRFRERGIRIPEDISLVSYGNTDLARYFTPSITSIDGRAEEMARQTAQIIRGRRSGADMSMSQYVIAPELVIRDT